MFLTEGLKVRVLPAEKIEEAIRKGGLKLFSAPSVIERLFLT